MAQQLTYAQFGEQFMRLVFSPQLVGQAMTAVMPRQMTAVENVGGAKVHVTVTTQGCNVHRLPDEFAIFIPLQIALIVQAGPVREDYQIRAQVEVRMQAQTWAPLVVYMAVKSVPESAVQLYDIQSDSWLQLARRFGNLEQTMRQRIAQEMNTKLAQSKDKRVIDLLQMVQKTIPGLLGNLGRAGRMGAMSARSAPEAEETPTPSSGVYSAEWPGDDVPDVERASPGFPVLEGQSSTPDDAPAGRAATKEGSAGEGSSVPGGPSLQDARSISRGQRLEGTLGKHEAHYYRIPLQTGESLRLQVYMQRTTDGLISGGNGSVAITDREGGVVESETLTVNTFGDDFDRGELVFEPKEAGDHFVRVRLDLALGEMKMNYKVIVK